MESQTPLRSHENTLISIVKRRAKPRVILLNEDLSIAFAEADAMAFLLGLLGFPETRIDRLPFQLERAIEEVVVSWAKIGNEDEQTIAPMPNIIMRVSRLHGPGGAFIAAFIEEHQRREDLAGSARHYRLTRRELQVLELVLGGYGAAQIAETLNIAETTVSDYFKQLLRKTEAKNRADMLAKVLGWGAQNAVAESESASQNGVKTGSRIF